MFHFSDISSDSLSAIYSDIICGILLVAAISLRSRACSEGLATRRRRRERTRTEGGEEEEEGADIKSNNPAGKESKTK